MTDGLEISEIRYSELPLDNEKYRIDSEFYLKRYINAYQKIKTIKHTTINDSMSCLTDFHANGSYETIAANFELLDSPNYAYMVRTTDLETDNYSENVKYITKHAYEFLAKSKIFGGELLINKIGSPGRTYLMPKLDIPVSLGMNLFMLRIKSGVNTNESLLYLFFNSAIGKAIIERKINGTVPLTIDKEAVKSLYIPLFSENFNNKLLALIAQINTFKSLSKKHYESAERLLKDYLRFASFDLDKSYAVKTISNSFIESGRLDAEYYQPKYESLIAQINTNETVSSLCNLFDSNFIPESDNEYRYIELSNVGVFGDISNIEKVIGNDLPSRARRVVKTGQVVVSSIEGSLSSCALIDSEYDSALCSTGFYIINSDKINSETLLVLFKSKPIQALLKQRCSGTILTAISKEEFLNMPLPYIDDNVQKEISVKVKESFRLRKEAKLLLDKAIKAVEMAVEMDEASALLWLEL